MSTTSSPTTGAPTTSNTLTIDAPEGQLWIDAVREFDAPVSAVFEAHRDPEKVKRWLGPDGYEMNIERYDFTSGGGYRYVHRDPVGVCGLISPWNIESMRFEDLGGHRTRLRLHAVYPSLEARDGMAQNGMEEGMAQGYAHLDALLAGG